MPAERTHQRGEAGIGGDPARALRHAQLVLLGESSHGTHEWYAVRRAETRARKALGTALRRPDAKSESSQPTRPPKLKHEMTLQAGVA